MIEGQCNSIGILRGRVGIGSNAGHSGLILMRLSLTQEPLASATWFRRVAVIFAEAVFCPTTKDTLTNRPNPA